MFRKGDPFDAIAAVRAGTVKTYVVDREGRERVLGFHLPGEVIGLDAIDGEHYPVQRDRARHRRAVPLLVSRGWPSWPRACPGCSSTCSGC